MSSSLFRQAVAVTVLMGGAGWLIAGVASLTDSRIRDNERRKVEQLAVELVGVATSLDVDAIVVCDQPHDLILVAESGYGGALRLAARVGPTGIESVALIEHHETPGFTDFLAAPSRFLDQLLDPEQAVDAVSGATITANAVRRAVVEAERRVRAPIWNGVAFIDQKARDCRGASAEAPADG